MSALTVSAVRALDPATLTYAADAVSAAAEVAHRGTSELTAHADEHETGIELTGALAVAHLALAAGAADLARARTHVVNLVDTALAQGFDVAEDGAVTAPHRPLAVEGIRAHRAHRLGRQITAALETVDKVDAATSQALTTIDFPATLGAEIDAYLDRLVTSKSVVGSLGTNIQGAVSGAAIAKKGLSLTVKGSAFARFLRPLLGYSTLAKHLGTANIALKEFMIGRSSGGVLQAIVGARVSGLVGRLFLPLTVITGLIEVFTGGGYKGVRGLATRAFGLAGAVGAGLLLVSYSDWLSQWLQVGALESAVCGVAVLLYGLWSLGNAIWDHHLQIWRFFVWLAKLPVRIFRRGHAPADTAPATESAAGSTS